jgi:hypothetical protein
VVVVFHPPDFFVPELSDRLELPGFAQLLLSGSSWRLRMQEHSFPLKNKKRVSMLATVGRLTFVLKMVNIK